WRPRRRRTAAGAGRPGARPGWRRRTWVSPPGVSSCRTASRAAGAGRRGRKDGMTTRPRTGPAGETHTERAPRNTNAEHGTRKNVKVAGRPYAAAVAGRAAPGARGRVRPLASGSRCGRKAVRRSRSRIAVRTRVGGTTGTQRADTSAQTVSAAPAAVVAASATPADSPPTASGATRNSAKGTRTRRTARRRPPAGRGRTVRREITAVTTPLVRHRSRTGPVPPGSVAQAGLVIQDGVRTGAGPGE